MQYRYIERVSTGERTGALFTSERLAGDPDAQAADIAAALGWPADDARAVTVEADPGPGNVTLPTPEPVPDPIDPQSALLNALADGWEQAAADLKAGRTQQAAEALERAAAVARGAARG